MLFWSTTDTFSIIDALLKLILVITCSALIICFCHRLTNYKKKSRCRYKTNESSSAVASQQLFEANNARFYQRAFDCATDQPVLPANLFTGPSLYDPYNRPPVIYPYLSTAPACGTPNGTHSTTSAQASGNSLTTFELPGSSALVANPAYSVGANSARYQTLASSLTLEDDQCPSYEEAVAAATAGVVSTQEPNQQPESSEPTGKIQLESAST